ncbi:MAG: LLM class F420-dependent oxidoreductase, partial [Roseicyclus sp.]
REDMHGSVLVSSDPERFVGWLAEYAELGFEGIYLHHVGVSQRRFIDVFGERVLPALARG